MVSITRRLFAITVICWLSAFSVVVPIASAAEQQKRPIFFNYDTNIFTATGYWISSLPNAAPGFQSETQIDCFREKMGCVQATAAYYSGHPHVTLGYLRVIKWDRDGIIATDSSGICTTTTIQIAFAEKRISSTHSMKQLDDKTREGCKFFEANKTQEESFVLRGSERWVKERSTVPEQYQK